MKIFLSKYQNKIDRQGRVTVPAAFRTILAEDNCNGYNGVIIYPSFKNLCLEACSMAYFQQIYLSIKNLDPYSEERDAFETVIMGESHQLPFDNEGRIIIPANLLSQANIDNQATFVGKGAVFEIWESGKFEQYLESVKLIAQKNRFILKNQQVEGL